MLELWYPVKPLYVNQPFGASPEYYARFKDTLGNPYKGHMGLDLQASHGEPVYAPCDGKAVYIQDSHGGDGFYIYTEGYCVILWHLCSKDDPLYKPLIPCDGSLTPVKVGQLIGYADNTGAPFESSGDHLHVGLFPTNSAKLPLDPANGFGGNVDPAPFFNRFFAVDEPQVMGVFEKLLSLLTALRDSLLKGRG